jgi:hypothetical protein
MSTGGATSSRWDDLSSRLQSISDGELERHLPRFARILDPSDREYLNQLVAQKEWANVRDFLDAVFQENQEAGTPIPSARFLSFRVRDRFARGAVLLRRLASFTRANWMPLWRIAILLLLIALAYELIRLNQHFAPRRSFGSRAFGRW